MGVYLQIGQNKTCCRVYFTILGSWLVLAKECGGGSVVGLSSLYWSLVNDGDMVCSVCIRQGRFLDKK